MFEDSLLESGNRLRKRSPWTTFISFLLQVGLLGVLVLIPLIYTDALPKQQLMTFLVAPPPPPPPPPPPAAAPVVKQVKVQTELDNGQLRTPTAIPKKIAMIKEEEAPPSAGAGVVGGVPGGVPGGQRRHAYRHQFRWRRRGRRCRIGRGLRPLRAHHARRRVGAARALTIGGRRRRHVYGPHRVLRPGPLAGAAAQPLRAQHTHQQRQHAQQAGDTQARGESHGGGR